MSGGSFEYLCFAEPDELFRKRDELKRMAEALAADGHIDAAKETESVRLILNQFEALMRARLDRLHDVWKAVEWTHSGDTAPSAITEAIADYRKAAGFAYSSQKGKSMNLSPLGQAIYNLIRADRANAGPNIIEADCDAIERALHKLIRQELIVHNVLVERNPVD